MTPSQARSLTRGQWVYHTTLTNADSTPLRARCNGQIQEWRRSGEWRIPMKHGLRNCFYITPENYAEWQLDQEPSL